MPDFGIFRGFNDKLFGNKLYAGQLPTQLGTIGSIDFTPFVLDLYPSAAAAYSLRLLRSAYTGNAIRVRRSSDNTEQDIGFMGSGELDTSSLTSFCGSGNGFVTTWYDQSGNARNATQTTAANQPQIVSSGSVLSQNSKPSVYFQDNTDRLFCLSSGSSVNNTMVTVSKFNTPLTGYRVIMSIGATSSSSYALLGWGVFPYQRGIYTIGNQSLNGNYTSNQEIWGSTTTTNLAKLWVNGNSQSITNNTTTYTANLTQINLGNDEFGSALIGNLQEAIYWNTTQSDTNLIAINTNQNFYYNAY